MVRRNPFAIPPNSPSDASTRWVLNIKFRCAKKITSKKNTRAHINIHVCIIVFYMVWLSEDLNNIGDVTDLALTAGKCVCVCVAYAYAHTFNHHTIAHKKRQAAKAHTHTRGDATLFLNSIIIFSTKLTTARARARAVRDRQSECAHAHIPHSRRRAAPRRAFLGGTLCAHHHRQINVARLARIKVAAASRNVHGAHFSHIKPNHISRTSSARVLLMASHGGGCDACVQS